LKTLIEALLKRALDSLPEDLVAGTARGTRIEVENTRDAQHGDFASNLAMRLGRATQQNPRKLAQALVAALPSERCDRQGRNCGRGLPSIFLEERRVTPSRSTRS